MPTLFWTGKISLPLRIMINMGSIIAWVTGNARNTSAMKEKMKNGYDGKYSDYIHKYDEMGLSHYAEISKKLIEKVDCSGKEIVDIGCGTGILSLISLEKGAAKITCVDMSKLMLDKCKKKIIAAGYNDDVISFHEADAERLPFADNTYDVVLLNMVLGMVPNQQATLIELTRVLRPGGCIALSSHGPAHYMEAIESLIKTISMRYFSGHRFEFWPRDENELKNFFMNSGLNNIHTERLTWRDEFKSGSEAFDFFASTSGLWWNHRLPPEIRDKETEKTRAYFQSKNVTEITSDVVLAFGSLSK